MLHYSTNAKHSIRERLEEDAKEAKHANETRAAWWSCVMCEEMIHLDALHESASKLLLDRLYSDGKGMPLSGWPENPTLFFVFE
jgi:hypothetical protein